MPTPRYPNCPHGFCFFLFCHPAITTNDKAVVAEHNRMYVRGARKRYFVVAVSAGGNGRTRQSHVNGGPWIHRCGLDEVSGLLRPLPRECERGRGGLDLLRI